ncbi:MAG: cupin domain-containing protein [Verrucomicrobiota bacterium]
MKPIVHPSNGDLGIRCFGGHLQFFLNQKQSNGWLLAGELISPPDNGPPLHTHRDEDEILTVIEGRFAFFADGSWTEGGPGTTAYLPRHQPHTFRNIGTTTGRLHVMANSPGLESFFHQCEDPFHLPEGPDMETITAIAAAHGIDFV